MVLNKLMKGIEIRIRKKVRGFMDFLKFIYGFYMENFWFKV